MANGNGYCLITPVICPKCEERLGDYHRYSQSEIAVSQEQNTIEIILAHHQDSCKVQGEANA